MKTYAAEIAAKLQGAHRARTRGRDMSKEATTEQVQQVGSSVWDDDPFVHAMKLVERTQKVLGDLAASGHAPGDPQASAVSAERVVELERHVAELERQLMDARDEIGRLGATAQGALYEQGRAEDDAAGIRELLATAYVAREVPWSDVAAGMMTIARDGTPWMVAERGSDPDGEIVHLVNGGQRFNKVPAPGETVRVLVPYVTPEAAEELVRTELGGTKVGA